MRTRITFVIFVLLFFGCEPAFDIDYVLPEYTEELYFFHPGRYDNCADTTVYFNKERLESAWLTSNSKYSYIASCHLGLGTLDSHFREWNADTVSFFIFDKEIVESIPWETIVEEYMVLQRYDVTKKDLERLNCVLYYPPTEEMKTIRMYPRYEVK